MSSPSLIDQIRAQYPELVTQWQQLHKDGADDPAAQRVLVAYDALLERLMTMTIKTEAAGASKVPFYHEGTTYVADNKEGEGRDVSTLFRNLCRIHAIYTQELQPLLRNSHKLAIDDHMAALAKTKVTLQRGCGL